MSRILLGSRRFARTTGTPGADILFVQSVRICSLGRRLFAFFFACGSLIRLCLSRTSSGTGSLSGVGSRRIGHGWRFRRSLRINRLLHLVSLRLNNLAAARRFLGHRGNVTRKHFGPTVLTTLFVSRNLSLHNLRQSSSLRDLGGNSLCGICLCGFSLHGSRALAHGLGFSLPLRCRRGPTRASRASCLRRSVSFGRHLILGNLSFFSCHYACSTTFFQSASKLARPRSVKGCCRHFLSAAKGTVAMSAPRSAACVTWLGVRTEAVMIST